jgi:predicted RNA polymerase sigma factor
MLGTAGYNLAIFAAHATTAAAATLPGLGSPAAFLISFGRRAKLDLLRRPSGMSRWCLGSKPGRIGVLALVAASHPLDFGTRSDGGADS